MTEYKEESGAKVYDLQGKFLSPGLIDAHVHVTAVPGVEVSVCVCAWRNVLLPISDLCSPSLGLLSCF